MRFHGTILILVIAMTPWASSPGWAQDELPAWSSREEVTTQVKAAKAAPAPKPKAQIKTEAKPVVDRRTIIYGENTSDEAPVKLTTQPTPVTPKAEPQPEPTQEVKEIKEGPRLVKMTEDEVRPAVDDAGDMTSTIERKRRVKIIHVKAHQRSLSSKTKPLINKKVTHKVITEEAPIESEADILPQPVASQSTQPAASDLPAAPARQAEAPEQKLVYTIRKGDTLWGISRKFNVKIDAIKTANGLDSDIIKPGQNLTIPSKNSPKVASAHRGATPQVASSPSPRVASTSETPAVSRAEARQPNDSALSNNAAVREAQLKLREVAIKLARHDIDYNQKWRPPGEKKAWVMDCSNTSRYLMQAAAGLEIPRTASSQYWVLDNNNLIWRSPKDSEGRPDKTWLARNLQVGDLLFWEHTYKPVREPPVTHVTVFLGRNKKGEWIMAGSQSAQRGELTDDVGGPDLYVFNPHAPSGGYSTFLGINKVKGRFVGIGRPLGLLSKKDDVKISKR